jgi:DNA-binding transcriptional LysR family regulator
MAGAGGHGARAAARRRLPTPRCGPAGRLPPRRIALIWHRDRYRSPAARAFVEIALDVARELAADLEPGRSAPA